MITWALVALGGAVGTAVGLLVVRWRSLIWRLAVTASACALMGAFEGRTHSWWLTALVSVGFLGSVAGMVALCLAPPPEVTGDSILRTTWTVGRRLAVHCVVAVAFAMVGYLAVRGNDMLSS